MIIDYNQVFPGLDDKIHDDIHRLYGGKSGLLKSEYHVFFDPDPELGWDIRISSGKVIHILLNTEISKHDYHDKLKQVFLEQRNPNLRSFLRVRGGIRETKETIEGLSIRNPEIPLEKHPKVGSFYTTLISTIKVTDRKSKKSIELAVGNSDAFTVQTMAIKKLYGERWEE